MEQKNDVFSIQEAMRLAATPVGQQLLEMLKRNDTDALTRIRAKASSGDYSGAQQDLSQLLNTPEALALLKKLEG